MRKLRFKSKKMLIMGGIAALGLASAAFLYVRNSDPPKTTTENPVGEKALPNESATGTSSSSAGQPEEEKSTETTTQSATFALTLVRAGQIDNVVQVRALVDGATSGTCRVDFTGPGTSFYKTTEFAFDGRTYSCGALNATTSEFSKAGSWNYALKATSGSKVSNNITGTVSIMK